MIIYSTIQIPITDEDFLEKYLDLEEQIFIQLYPHEEVPPREIRRISNMQVQDDNIITAVVAEKDGKLVGRGIINHNTVNEERRHICYLVLQVLPDHQNQGIATEILKNLTKIAEKMDIQTYRCTIPELFDREDNSQIIMDWVHRVGGTETDANSRSRIYAKDMDIEMIKGIYDQLAVKLQHIKLEFVTKKQYLEGLLTDDDYALKLLDHFNEVGSLIPRGNSSRSFVVDTLETVRRKAKSNIDSGWNNLSYFAYDTNNDKYVGSSLVYFPEADQLIQVNTGLTGVRKAYQGQGIATYLKCAMLLKLHELGFKHISTGNNEDNKPMLAINHKLGFKPISITHFFEGKFDDIIS